MNSMLRYFKIHEFRGWFDYVSPELKCKLDKWRHLLELPVLVSTAEGSVGRNLGFNSRSRHNVDRWGEVQAIDVMPLWDRAHVEKQVETALTLAEYVKFGGIGFYPEWHPRMGLHLDVRPLEERIYWIREEDDEGNQKYNYHHDISEVTRHAQNSVIKRFFSNRTRGR